MDIDINKLIAADLTGQISDSEKRELEDWLKDPTNQLVYRRLKKYWDKDTSAVDQFKISEIRDNLWYKAVHDNQKHFDFMILLKVAAILLVFVAVFWSIEKMNVFVKNPSVVEAKTILKSNPAGMKSIITLPDGSRVNLNAESSISYPEVFSDTLRIVRLKGEAFFDVTRATNRPFIVEIENTSIEVLGTSFNIRAFPGENDVQISLQTGQVRVERVSGTQVSEYFLSPGQFIQFEQDGIETGHFDHEQTLGWKDGIVVFQKADFDLVVKRLERWYGVEFTYTGEKPEWKFNGRFVNENLENILEILSHSERFSYVIKNRKVTINFND